jgi:hypothetical protein
VLGRILVARASSWVIPDVLAVASFSFAQPAPAAASGGQAQASASQACVDRGGASVNDASSAPRGGTWGNAELVPGTAALNSGNGAGVGAVSCTSPGDCTAMGFYTTSQVLEYAFVASQVNGSCGKAVPASGIPGIGDGTITNDGAWTEAQTIQGAGEGVYYSPEVACVSAGNCFATLSGYVVAETGGNWGAAGGNADFLGSVSARKTVRISR